MSDGDSGHALTFFSATLTGVGATLAVILVMFVAFFGACMANFGTDAAYVLGEFGPAGHER